MSAVPHLVPRSRRPQNHHPRRPPLRFGDTARLGWTTTVGAKQTAQSVPSFGSGVVENWRPDKNSRSPHSEAGWRCLNAGYALTQPRESEEMTGVWFEIEHVCAPPRGRDWPADYPPPRSPLDPGLVSVRRLDCAGSDHDTKGYVHVHQAYRYADRHAERRRAAR